MPSLQSVLGSIPGIAGYEAAKQQNAQTEMQQLQKVGALQQIAAKLQMQAQQQQAMEREGQMRGLLAAHQGNPEAVIPKLIQMGPEGVKLAGTLAEATKDLRPPKPVQTEIEKLLAARDALPDGNPNKDILSRAIEAKMPKATAPQTRKIRMGEQEVTQEFDPKTGWKEIGRGPAFARQVAQAGGTTLHTQGTLDPEAVKDLAIQSLYDPNATMGYRRDPKMMSQIANERVRLMKEGGVTSEDVVSGRAGFKADTASLNKITPQYDAITAFEKTAIRNGKILIELADKADTTGVPVLERWIRAGRVAVAGDTDVAKFNAQMNLYRAEAARILTQPNLSGVLTDTARKEMEEVIRNSASASQVREVVNLLERDFNNRKETLEEQISAIRARMRSRASPGGADAIKAPESTSAAIPEFATEAEAAKAGLKPGTKIKIGGRPGTWQ